MGRIGKVLMWPREKFRATQQSVSDLTPYQKWNVVRRMCDFSLRLVGIHVVSDCEINWLTPVAGLCSLQYALLSIYTAWYYWNENRISSIQPQVIMAIMIPVMKVAYDSVVPHGN